MGLSPKRVTAWRTVWDRPEAALLHFAHHVHTPHDVPIGPDTLFGPRRLALAQASVNVPFFGVRGLGCPYRLHRPPHPVPRPQPV